jgi:hypothetical protein
MLYAFVAVITYFTIGGLLYSADGYFNWSGDNKKEAQLFV